MDTPPPIQSPFDVRVREGSAGQVELELTCKQCGHSFIRELPRPSLDSGTSVEIVCPNCGKGKATIAAEETPIA